MNSTGSTFYLQNAHLLSAGGTREIERTELNVILQVQAALVYKTRLSTKFATKALGRYASIIRKDHCRLKNLMVKRGIRFPVLVPDKEQIDELKDVFDGFTTGKHAQEAGDFLRAVLDVKLHRDEEARTTLSTYSKLLPFAPVPKPEQVVITTRSGRISKPTLKRKAIDEEIALKNEAKRRKTDRKSGYTVTAENHNSAIYTLTFRACAATASQRIQGALLTQREIEVQREYVQNDGFAAFTYEKKRTWIALRQNAARVGCTTTLNAEFTESRLQKFEAASNPADRSDEVAIIDTYKNENGKLHPMNRLAYRRKFMGREIDINTLAPKVHDDGSYRAWENSPVVALWSGPVESSAEKDAVYGLHALVSAFNVQKEKALIVKTLRALEEARVGNEHQPIVTTIKQVDCGMQRQLMSPPPTPTKRVVVLVEQPLSAVPYRMRQHMSGSKKNGHWCMGTLYDLENEGMHSGKMLVLKRSSNLRLVW